MGWCQLTPRTALPQLERASRLRPFDDLPVWCISCFYVRIGYRKRGITAALIAEALRVARKNRARALEAYPLNADLSPSATGTGYASTFARLGFKEIGRRFPPRPIMRFDLKTK